MPVENAALRTQPTRAQGSRSLRHDGLRHRRKFMRPNAPDDAGRAPDHHLNPHGNPPPVHAIVLAPPSLPSCSYSSWAVKNWILRRVLGVVPKHALDPASRHRIFVAVQPGALPSLSPTSFLSRSWVSLGIKNGIGEFGGLWYLYASWQESRLLLRSSRKASLHGCSLDF